MPVPPEPAGLPGPADVLLSKARQDQHLAVLVVHDASVSNEHVGFFCQQAIEKAIKSVLSRCAIRYRRTHDLAELLDLLKDHQIEHPPQLEQSVALTTVRRRDALRLPPAGTGPRAVIRPKWRGATGRACDRVGDESRCRCSTGQVRTTSVPGGRSKTLR
jgi:hypothetical protein